MTTTAPATRRVKAALATLLVALLAIVGQTPAHAAALTSTTTVAYTDSTPVRGTPLKTWYQGEWARNSTHTWATGGALFEIPFAGESFTLFGRKATTNGTADVYVDDVKVGSAAGEVVSLDGAPYRAKWWTRAQTPGSPSGPWERIG